jgi:hypothetical protein
VEADPRAHNSSGIIFLIRSLNLFSAIHKIHLVEVNFIFHFIHCAHCAVSDVSILKGSYQISVAFFVSHPTLEHFDSATQMPVSLEEVEEVLRKALPVSHLEIHDQSSGCGENYAILVVSEVSLVSISLLLATLIANESILRRSKGSQLLQGIESVRSFEL